MDHRDIDGFEESGEGDMVYVKVIKKTGGMPYAGKKKESG